MKLQNKVFLSLVCMMGLSRLAIAETSWPDYRGPKQDGSVKGADLPLQWSEGNQVIWKTAVHGRGWSSPVVADGQVWITTATPDGRELYVLCVDATSGKILLNRKLFQINKPQFAHAFNSYASPSPLVDSSHVYVSFGSPGTACLDLKTHKVLWERTDLVCDHFRGAGSSPFVFENLIILTMDGADYQYLIALDKLTGNTIWRAERSTDFGDLDPNTNLPKRGGDFRKSYATPVLAQVNGQSQLISPGAKAVFAYDPRTGKEIWTIRYGNHSSAARTLVGNEMAFINTGYGKAELLGIRIDGKGDATDTHIVWRLRKGAPNKPSPVLHNGHLYTVTDGGVASCIHPKTGDVIWQARIGGEYSASLLLSKGNIYCFDQGGTCLVFQANPKKFKQVSKSKLDDGFMSSPAVLLNSLILRTKTHLYRIQKKLNK